MAKTKNEYAFTDLTRDVLQQEKKPLTTKQIWNMALEKGFDKNLDTKANDKVLTLNSIIYQDVKKDISVFYKVSNRPIKWGLKECIDYYKNVMGEESEENTKENETTSRIRETRERHLHKLLVSFVRDEPSFGTCYAKTIYHEKSKNKSSKTQHWIQPDIVGVTFPFGAGRSYEERTVELMKTLEHCRCIIYSFEMKYKVGSSNELREYFFQAVSNSSWAHEGYLVAESFNKDELFDDMAALNSAFGIGFIELNVGNYRESQILFKAKRRKELDWDMIDKLIETNEDFNDFIGNVMDYLGTSKIHNEKVFDPVFENDKEYNKYIKQNKLK